MVSELEAPPIKQRRKRRTKAEMAESGDLAKSAIIAMVGVSLQTTFHAIAFKLGDNWKLEEREVAELAISLDNALSTLPGDSYVKILEYVAKISPWFGLAITANSIITPRIQQSARDRHAKSNQGKSDNKTTTATQQQQTDFGASWRTNPDFASLNTNN